MRLPAGRRLQVKKFLNYKSILIQSPFDASDAHNLVEISSMEYE